MAVSIKWGAVRRLRAHPEYFVVQVDGAVEADRAAEALKRARGDVSRLDAEATASEGGRSAPSHVSEVELAESGPFFAIDGAMVAFEVLEAILDMVQGRLEEAGVEEAVIDVLPAGGPLDVLQSTPHAALVRLYPPRDARFEGSTLPSEWLARGVVWVAESAPPLRVAVGPVQFSLAPERAGEFLEACRKRNPQRVTMVGGELDGRIRALTACSWPSSLALASGGSPASVDDLPELVEELKGIARRFAAGAAYAFIDVIKDFAALTVADHGTDWWVMEGGEAPNVVEVVRDQLVLEAAPFQVLGPGHMSRLGSIPDQARQLTDERWELDLYQPITWNHSDPKEQAAIATGRRLLSGCLLKRGEAQQLPGFRIR